jgi:hypothetical protein
MWGKILQAVLQLAGSSKINFMAVFQWFMTHTGNVNKAIEDLKAGADWGTVISDLFGQMQAFASSKRGSKMACNHDECCKAFCSGVGHALVEYHSGDKDGADNALKHMSDAYIALAIECGVPDEPCEPCTDDEIAKCAAVASGNKP